MINGITIGILEILLYLYVSIKIEKRYYFLKTIPTICYYWYMMTILTLIWELSYIINYYDVVKMSKSLLINEEHVWTKHYQITDINPWNLSPIFYSEYGAYADREYMSETDQWSKIVEGSHLIFCGIFSICAIVSRANYSVNLYNIFATLSMGSQLMNSILYMSNYFLQSKMEDSVNFDNSTFPMGNGLSDRPFMWVNIFWTVMPIYCLYKLIRNACIMDNRMIHTIE